MNNAVSQCKLHSTTEVAASYHDMLRKHYPPENELPSFRLRGYPAAYDIATRELVRQEDGKAHHAYYSHLKQSCQN